MTRETDRCERLRNVVAERIRACAACRLHKSRTRAVPGEGPADARVMCVGEAPGAEEDKEGRPFVGRAGTFFDELLEQVGLHRQQIYITSAVKCRPPENRDPRSDELATCRKLWLRKQTELVDPNLVVLMGKVAARQSLGKEVKLADEHGQVRERNGRRFMLTYHPAAGMRFPEPASAIRQDFARISELAEGE